MISHLGVCLQHMQDHIFLLINYGLISLINPQVEIVTVMSHYAIESSPIGQSLRPIITISTVWFKHAAT